MTAGLFLCLCLGIETLAETPISERPATGDVARIERALAQDRDLLDLHRGYLDYLTKHPRLAEGETAWRDLSRQFVFSEIARDFDEALHEDAEAQVLFDQFYDQLARDGDLRDAVDRLRRTELTSKQLGALFNTGMTYLRANPEEAMRFLENPDRMRPLPEALEGLGDVLEENPGFGEELGGAIQGLRDNPLTYTRLLPWWQRVSAQDRQPAAAYAKLQQHFADRPSHFWVWHQRYVALAADNQARAWIRHWHRRVRRTPEIATQYYGYLALIEKEPAYAERAEKGWRASYGAPPNWPPKEAPPVLARLPRHADRLPERPDKKDMTPTYAHPGKPTVNKPTVSRPSRPAKPAMPARPTAPEPR